MPTVDFLAGEWCHAVFSSIVADTTTYKESRLISYALGSIAYMEDLH